MRICVCARVRMSACAVVRLCVRGVRTCARASVRDCVRVSVCACAHVRMCACAVVCMCVRLCVCVVACVSVYFVPSRRCVSMSRASASTPRHGCALPCEGGPVRTHTLQLPKAARWPLHRKCNGAMRIHQRIADVAKYLTGSRKWDLLMLESHASDYTSHFFLGQADPTSGAEPAVLKRSREGVFRTYQSIDRMIGRVLEDIADEDTVVAVVAILGCACGERVGEKDQRMSYADWWWLRCWRL